MAAKRIICFGPGPAFKGGISNYNTSLALALEKEGAEVHIVSWTQQYPAIIPRDFKDRASRSDFLENSRIKVAYLCNYNSPLSWKRTFQYIREWKPDMVIFQWAIAIQGIPYAYLASRLKKIKGIEVVFDCHLVVQKEGSAIDNALSKLGLKHAHTYLAHAYKTVEELKALYPQRDWNVNENGVRVSQGAQIIKLYHPVYDLFQPKSDFDREGAKREMGLKQHVFLFFGFIRKYKGLHQVIQAFHLLQQKRDDVSLLIVGESFWDTLPANSWSAKLKKALFGLAKKVFLKSKDDESDYRPLTLLKELGVEQNCVLINRFVPNEEVHRYFQVSDAIVLFYLTATPSGVESLSYNFELPVLATDVGHFPETVKDAYNGYLAKDGNIRAMADVMARSIERPIDRRNIRETAAQLSWSNYALAILDKIAMS